MSQTSQNIVYEKLRDWFYEFQERHLARRDMDANAKEIKEMDPSEYAMKLIWILKNAGVAFAFAPCEGCDGSGVRPNATQHAGPPPVGYTVIERCDTCMKYADDLEAAKAWGDDARWQNGDDISKGTIGGDQAIARPRPLGDLPTFHAHDFDAGAMLKSCFDSDVLEEDRVERALLESFKQGIRFGSHPQPPEQRHNFTLAELGNTYVDDTDRFIVSLIVGYGADSPAVKTPQQAVGAALELTTDEGSYDTHWYCFDRKDGSLHLIEQNQAEQPDSEEEVQS